MEKNLFMPSIDVSKCGGNVMVALKRLKRTCDKNGLPRRWREVERRAKATAERRRSQAAAVKRQSKRIQNLVKNVLTASHRYKNTSVQKVINLFQ